MNRRANSSREKSFKQQVKLCGEVSRLALRLLLNPNTARWIPRILAEGIAPVRRMSRLKFIEAHNMREIKNLLAADVPIIFVTSFPRSGNTWMRYLLSDVFLQKEGIDTTTKLVIHPDEIIADFYRSLVAERNPKVRTPGVLVKIHDSFGGLRQRFWGDLHHTHPSFHRCRHLYLYRNPEDALVSLYHHHLQEDLVVENSAKWIGPAKIDEFCRRTLPAWIDHASGYLAATQEGLSIYFASYEGLLTDPTKVLGEVLRWLGVSHTMPMLERAVSNMQFEKLKATNARDMGHHGRSGAGSLQLAGSTIEEIRGRTAPLVKRMDVQAAHLTALPSATECLSGGRT